MSNADPEAGNGHRLTEFKHSATFDGAWVYQLRCSCGATYIAPVADAAAWWSLHEAVNR